jgi:hypothetical protein
MPEIQDVSSIAAPSLAALSYRKLASAETSSDSCGTQDSGTRNSVAGCLYGEAEVVFGHYLTNISLLFF